MHQGVEQTSGEVETLVSYEVETATGDRRRAADRRRRIGAGLGMYTAALALWPLLPVWWPWLVAGLVAVVALGARWLWWRLPERQAKTNEAAATGEPDVPPIFHALRHRLVGRGCGDHDRLRLTIRDPKARTDGLQFKTTRSRRAFSRALHHPFEIQKSHYLR